MPKALVIVETQAKAATIAAQAGPDYRVVATEGPLRDIPQNQLGFPLEGRFELDFEIPEERKASVEKIVAAAKGCRTVYLAMDPDAEGEIAAWHAREVLRERLPEGTAFKRARATELTVRGLRQAFRYAGIVDMDAVESQKARRALDRLVAQRIAPYLWRNVQPGISIGRMQAVALRLVCSREHECETAKPVVRWRFGLQATGRAEPDTEIFFRLVDADGKPMVVSDKDRAPVVKTALSSAVVTVDTVRRESLLEEPPPPFTTETLLADASSVMGLTPARTQALARKLYEGCDIGGDGPVGLVTYPYTAETRISEPALAATREFIAARFGEAYVGADATETVTLGRPEAIRPTDPAILPDSLKGQLEPAELKIYALIWRRYIASRMAPAKIDRTIGVADALAADGINGFQLHATAENVVFRGHRILTATITPKSDDVLQPDVPAAALPPLSPGEALQVSNCVVESTPPETLRRYTEADFVRILSSGGLGRPSTYAAFIGSFYQRKYAERRERQIAPTDLGRKTILWLFSVFPGLLGSSFAATTEASLDAIAAGKGTAAALVGQFVARFHRIWTGETRAVRADPKNVELILFSLESVVNWKSVNIKPAPGTDPGVDEARVEELRAVAAAGDGSLSEDEYEELLAIFCRYRPQIPGYIEIVKKIERYDLLQLPDNAPDARIIQMKLDWVDKAPLSPESRRFVDSLKHQAESGRHLTEAQVRVLDEILAAQALRIEGLTKEDLDEMGIIPRTKEDLDTIQRLLDALGSVKEWRPPSQHGKRMYDDASFTASVRKQFAQRGDLSPAQLEAVRRMVIRYHDKIDCYAELVPIYNLPPDGPTRSPATGRRGRRPIARAHSLPPGETPVYDDI